MTENQELHDADVVERVLATQGAEGANVTRFGNERALALGRL